MDLTTKTLAEQFRESPGAQATEPFLARLKADLDGLLALVGDKGEEYRRTKRLDPDGAECQALAVLTFARWRDAADLCADLIDVRRTDFTTVSDEAQGHFVYFPFAVAAAAIGTTTTVAVLSETVRTADPTTTRFQLSCLVLRQILGEYLVLASLGEIDAERQEQVSAIVQTPLARWRANRCSDYTIR